MGLRMQVSEGFGMSQSQSLWVEMMGLEIGRRRGLG